MHLIILPFAGEDGDTVGGVGACRVCVQVLPLIPILSLQGDSGGGLHCLNDESGGAELVGITSWGSEVCALRHKPTVYTQASSYISWIYEKCPDCKSIQESSQCFHTFAQNGKPTNENDYIKTSIHLILMIIVFLLCK